MQEPIHEERPMQDARRQVHGSADQAWSENQRGLSAKEGGSSIDQISATSRATASALGMSRIQASPSKILQEALSPRSSKSFRVSRP